MSSRSSRQPARSRTPGPKLLVVCEGPSKVAYLKAIRSHLRLPRERLPLLNPDGTDPLTIVEAAITVRDGLRRDREWGAGDAAWAAFDGDEHRQNDPDRWNWALALAERERVHLAVSNPCLELWYLWHFQEQSADLHRDRAEALLKTYVPRYEKPDCPVDALMPGREAAIARAENAFAAHARNSSDSYTNPCSGMGQLIQAVFALKR